MSRIMIGVKFISQKMQDEVCRYGKGLYLCPPAEGRYEIPGEAEEIFKKFFPKRLEVSKEVVPLQSLLKKGLGDEGFRPSEATESSLTRMEVSERKKED